MIRKHIPNGITCLNLSCGVLAILVPNLEWSVFLIILGGIFDVFDGMAAKALKVSSKIGAELDSLSDVISFGVAPAVIYYKTFGTEFGYWGYLAPVIVVIGGAIRLARYNVTISEDSYFRGLAIPSSGLLLCGLVYGRTIIDNVWGIYFVFMSTAIILCLLNVSRIRMFSFKQIGMMKTKIYFGIIAAVTIITMVMQFRLSLFVAILSYIVIAAIDHITKSSERAI